MATARQCKGRVEWCKAKRRRSEALQGRAMVAETGRGEDFAKHGGNGVPCQAAQGLGNAGYSMARRGQRSAERGDAQPGESDATLSHARAWALRSEACNAREGRGAAKRGWARALRRRAKRCKRTAMQSATKRGHCAAGQSGTGHSAGKARQGGVWRGRRPGKAKRSGGRRRGVAMQGQGDARRCKASQGHGDGNQKLERSTQDEY